MESKGESTPRRRSSSHTSPVSPHGPHLVCMSWNVEYGGQLDKLDLYKDVIAKEGVDVICLQEIFREDLYYKSLENNTITAPEDNIGRQLAKMLGYYYAESKVTYMLCIISRFPIVKVLTNDNQVLAVSLDNGINVANVHFTDEPCTYYTLRGIKYYNTPDPEEKIPTEKATKLMYQVKRDNLKHLFLTCNHLRVPLLVMGDFNEPSHLDWNETTCAAGQTPVVADWLTSKEMAKKGFVDVIRALHPNPLTEPMHTADVVTKCEEGNIPERIDFIYAKGNHFEVLGSKRILSPLSDHVPIVCRLKVIKHRNVKSAIINKLKTRYRAHATMARKDGITTMISSAVNVVSDDLYRLVTHLSGASSSSSS